MEDQQQQEPVAWMWQHEETGNVGFVDAWQVANNWTENNPRLRLIAPLYRRASPSSSVLERAREALLGLVELAEDHWPNGATSRKGRAALAEIDRALGGGNAE